MLKDLEFTQESTWIYPGLLRKEFNSELTRFLNLGSQTRKSLMLTWEFDTLALKYLSHKFILQVNDSILTSKK